MNHPGAELALECLVCHHGQRSEHRNLSRPASTLRTFWGQVLRRIVKRFRGGLVFKAYTLFISLKSRLESNKGGEEDHRQRSEHRDQCMPTETKVESVTSQCKSRTFVNLRDSADLRQHSTHSGGAREPLRSVGNQTRGRGGSHEKRDHQGMAVQASRARRVLRGRCEQGVRKRK